MISDEELRTIARQMYRGERSLEELTAEEIVILKRLIEQKRSTISSSPQIEKLEKEN